MNGNETTCDSCNTSGDNVRKERRNNLNLCDVCRSWVRMSLRRTRGLPRWIRPDPSITLEELTHLREQFADSFQIRGRDRVHIQFHPNAMGFAYSGPLNERSWSVALSILTASNPVELSSNPLPKISQSEIDEELARLEEAGVIKLPKQPLIRKQLALVLRGYLGAKIQNYLITMVFLWLVSEDEFIARVPDAWATSFNFLREVVVELGDRASFVDGNIRVIGSSGNIYNIAPKRPTPYYQVSRLNNGNRSGICIDPIGAGLVVFGDVLVTVVLSLYDDQISARRINTLAPHVFGPTQRGLIRQRNIDHLWRRALGNTPLRYRHLVEENEEEDQTLPMVWQRLIDRFQTNLADWTNEEDDS